MMKIKAMSRSKKKINGSQPPSGCRYGLRHIEAKYPYQFFNPILDFQTTAWFSLERNAKH